MKKLLLFTVVILTFYASLTSVFAFNNAETGIRILKDGDLVYIVDVVANSPAEKAGILSGSRLYKINNRNINNYSPIEIVNLLYGEDKSSITLTIKQYNKKEKIELKREQLKISKNNFNNEHIQYWLQIAPPYFALNHHLVNNEEYPRNIKRYIFANNYWIDRRTNFINSYNTCVQSSLKNDCIKQIVEKEKATKNNPKGREWFMRMADQLSLFEEKYK